MSKPFAVFDIDGTVARTSLFLATVHEMMRRSMISPEDNDRIHQALDDWLKRRYDGAFLHYQDLCVEVLFKELGNIKVSAYESLLDTVMERFSDRIYTYPIKLIKQLKKQGYMILAVSGSEHTAVSRFCKQHGFDDWIGTGYYRDGFYFTGAASDVIFKKDQYLQQLIDKHNLQKHDSIGVGDTASDIPLLKMVAEPICFNPNQDLLAEARKRGWKIVIERKDVVYNLDPRHKQHLLV